MCVYHSENAPRWVWVLSIGLGASGMGYWLFEAAHLAARLAR